MEDRWVHVELPGHGKFYVLESAFVGGTSPLAPESHIEDGELVPGAALFGDSYAQVMADGNVRRFGHRIAGVNDLRRVR